MGQKQDKKLCWNCDGYVHLSLEKCPYCNTDLVENATGAFDQKAFEPPYSTTAKELAISEEDWNKALEKGETKKEEEIKPTNKEKLALILLLPGVVFFFFGLILFFFSKEGTLTLQWRESFAIFYLAGAIPLLFLGWRALR